MIFCLPHLSECPAPPYLIFHNDVVPKILLLNFLKVNQILSYRWGFFYKEKTLGEIFYKVNRMFCKCLPPEKFTYKSYFKCIKKPIPFFLNPSSFAWAYHTYSLMVIINIKPYKELHSIKIMAKQYQNNTSFQTILKQHQLPKFYKKQKKNRSEGVRELWTWNFWLMQIAINEKDIIFFKHFCKQ